ncbi:hypothetical protein [Shinella granuli]|uniref:hypothetical protein n=1 Tax=Shinella granuli TaxID=323621 RepID=UPI00105459EC|nr:hypothetical protein [Shinella granuli]
MIALAICRAIKFVGVPLPPYVATLCAMQQRHILCVQPPRMVDFPLQAAALVKLAFDEDLLNPKSTGLLIDVYGDLIYGHLAYVGD